MDVSTEEIKSLIERQGQTWEAFKKTNDARLVDISKKFDDVVTNDKLERINKELDEISNAFERIEKAQKSDRTPEEVKGLGERLDKIEVSLKRPLADSLDPGETAVWGGEAGEGGKASARQRYAKALYDFDKARLLRQGTLRPDYDPGKAPIEDIKAYERTHFPLYMRLSEQVGVGRLDLKALSVGVDPAGGYTVPPAMSDRIITKVYETTPMLSLATVETIGTDRLQMARDEGEFAFNWTSEEGARVETATSTFGGTEIVVHECYAMPKVTQQLLEDSAMDIEGWVSRKVADAMGRGWNIAWLTGNGSGKPRGLLTYPAGTGAGQIEQIPSLDANTITSDGLINLTYSLKDFYTPNARFLLRRSTRGVLRKLKDGDGNYLWHESFRVGEPATLLGFPVERGEDMPAVAAAALPIIFGDIRAAYTIVRRLGFTLLRDPYTAKPYVLFYTRARVGGAVVNFEAVKIMKVSAS